MEGVVADQVLQSFKPIGCYRTEQNKIYLFSQHLTGKSNNLQNAHTVKICFAIWLGIVKGHEVFRSNDSWKKYFKW